MKASKLLLFTAFVIFITEVKSQVIYTTDWKNEANKKVYVTENPSEADIIVFKSDWKSDAQKDSGIWFFTEWKTEADILVYYTEWRSEADLVICYTTYKEEAGKRK